MSQRKARGKGPLRREPRAGAASRDHARDVAATEIVAKLQQIAGSGAPGAARHVPNADDLRDGVFRLELNGSELTDSGLVARSRKPVVVEVFSIRTFPHPDDSTRVVLRVDGWDGHLELALPRDRAEVLAAGIAQAIDAAKIRERDRSQPAPALTPPRIRTEKWRSRTSHRKRVDVRDPRAIDSALDGLDDEGPTDDSDE